MNVIVDEDPAARLAVDLVALLKERDAAHVAVSGGSTPRQLFRLLATQYREVVHWDRVTLWQVDERTVPPEDRQSNWRMLHEELLSKIPELTAYRIEAERDGAADDYEQLLYDHVKGSSGAIPQLDVVLLGMGGDGHTASLFPGTAALAETESLVVRNEVPQLNTYRVTMTYPLINVAAERWFLAAGADKANAFAQVEAGKLPSAGIYNPVWYVDPAVVNATA